MYEITLQRDIQSNSDCDRNDIYHIARGFLNKNLSREILLQKG